MREGGRWRRIRRRCARCLPGSLRGRFVLIMVVGVLGAQLASFTIWTTQVRSSQLEQLDELSRNVAFSVASTVRFFRSLPIGYRHIVLDQLRDMGGTRFFVSVNERRIAVEDIGDGAARQLVVGNFRDVLSRELNLDELVVEFSRPETLRVFNNEVLLHDLPARWGQHSLLLEPLSPPILVVQLELEPGVWLYVATLLPVPDLLGENAWLSEERLLAGLIVLFTVIGLSLMGIRSATRPLARLSRAARQLGRDLDAPPLRESGPREVVATALAFNRMQEHIREQVAERERLFSAISHDLKTPITRLRLRAEMLDDPHQRERFCASLDELDLLVKGALASVKGLDLHEAIEALDPRDLLDNLAEELKLQGGDVAISGHAPPWRSSRWPSSAACPTCWKTRSSMVGVPRCRSSRAPTSWSLPSAITGQVFPGSNASVSSFPSCVSNRRAADTPGAAAWGSASRGISRVQWGATSPSSRLPVAACWCGCRCPVRSILPSCNNPPTLCRTR